jgi:hypothetical protein
MPAIGPAGRSCRFCKNPKNPGKNRPKQPFGVIAMQGGGHYNAHAVYRPAWYHRNDKRHKPPAYRMDVAFLMPEASQWPRPRVPAALP